MEAAVVGMDGDALLWYQWEHHRRSITKWGELKELVLRHFRPAGGDNIYEQLLSVSQLGSMEDYRRQFVKFAAHLEGAFEEVLLASFLKGLDPLMRGELRFHNPLTLEQAME